MLDWPMPRLGVVDPDDGHIEIDPTIKMPRNKELFFIFPIVEREKLAGPFEALPYTFEIFNTIYHMYYICKDGYKIKLTFNSAAFSRPEVSN